jgi:hypothetical protein
MKTKGKKEGSFCIILSYLLEPIMKIWGFGSKTLEIR